MAKLSKSNLPQDQAAQDETRQALSHLMDRSRYKHFTIGSTVVSNNITYEVIDQDHQALLLRDAAGEEHWSLPYATQYD